MHLTLQSVTFGRRTCFIIFFNASVVLILFSLVIQGPIIQSGRDASCFKPMWLMLKQWLYPRYISGKGLSVDASPVAKQVCSCISLGIRDHTQQSLSSVSRSHQTLEDETPSIYLFTCLLIFKYRSKFSFRSVFDTKKINSWRDSTIFLFHKTSRCQ